MICGMISYQFYKAVYGMQAGTAYYLAAAAAEVAQLAAHPAVDGPGHPHRAHGLQGRPSTRAGYAAGGHGAASAGGEACSCGHLFHYRAAHRAVALEVVGAHAQQTCLHLV